MQTEAIFENIAEHISSEINKANKSIFIAVAHFTNKTIFDGLVNKARKGCTVFLIIPNDEINQNPQIDFKQLTGIKTRIYLIGEGETKITLNNFCIIDNSIVITGSYNWTYEVENTFENIIITYDDTALAEQFINKFYNIRNHYYPSEPKEEVIFPLSKIIKRLEILKNYIILEDIAEFKRETHKLNEYSFNNDIDEIIKDIANEEFSSAIIKIQQFIAKNQQISIWSDPEIIALKLEIRSLENQLNAFDNEKIELEKLLSEFQHKHSIELGEIILEILRLRKLKYKTDKKRFDEAESDERQYREQVDAEMSKKVFELSEDEKKEIKKKFRKATILCHPDKVSDEFQEAAQRIFIELKIAYDANDLKKVTEILSDLEKGNYFTSKSETVSEKDMLKAAIAKLRRQIKDLEKEIILIKQSDTFKTVISIENWDEYFKMTAEKLQKELKELKREIEG